MKILNRNGPRTEPCGTPYYLSIPFVNKFPFRKTFCVLSCRWDFKRALLTNSANKLIISGIKLYDSQGKKKNLKKSKKTAPVG